jgi:hypothetical protein
MVTFRDEAQALRDRSETPLFNAGPNSNIRNIGVREDREPGGRTIAASLPSGRAQAENSPRHLLCRRLCLTASVQLPCGQTTLLHWACPEMTRQTPGPCHLAAVSQISGSWVVTPA